MNVRRKMRIDRRLWLAFGVVAFVLLGFVHLHNEGVENKAGPSSFWGIVINAPSAWEWWRVPLVIGACAVVLAVPAAAFGWVAQAVVVAIRTAKSSANRPPEPN